MCRVLAIVISLLLVFFLLAACPAPQESTPPPETFTPTPEEPTPAPEEPESGEEEEAELPGCPEQPEGRSDPNIAVDIYDPERAYNGTTLLPDNHDYEQPRIIEVNMSGEVVWEYLVPQNLKKYTNPGFDCELLSNGNILAVFSNKGIHEIDRDGNTVWSYLTSKISHDADRLPNGNTLFVFGCNDQKSDAQVTEVNSQGQVVWRWYARDEFDIEPYKDIDFQGWTHTNGVFRMANGNTLVSPRNFDIVVEVDPQGSVVNTYGEGVFSSQHDPEFLDNGNIIAALQWQDKPHKAAEFDINTGNVVWEYPDPNRANWPLRDANRLPNGNTLITGSREIVEVTTGGEIVWRLKLEGVTFSPAEAAARGFYKAQRICRSD